MTTQERNMQIIEEVKAEALTATNNPDKSCKVGNSSSLGEPVGVTWLVTLIRADAGRSSDSGGESARVVGRLTVDSSLSHQDVTSGFLRACVSNGLKVLPAGTVSRRGKASPIRIIDIPPEGAPEWENILVAAKAKLVERAVFYSVTEFARLINLSPSVVTQALYYARRDPKNDTRTAKIQGFKIVRIDDENSID